MQAWCPDATPYDELHDVIDALAAELADADEATQSGHVPITARACYLRAQAAHDVAVASWSGSGAKDKTATVRDALGQCRAALEAARERLCR